MIFAFVVLTLSVTGQVSAEKIAGASAKINYITYNSNSANQKAEAYVVKKTIREILEKYHSPMVDQVDSFYRACQTFEIDCYLLPSITGVESSFGQFIYPGTFNPFGWGRGLTYFKDWDEAIMTVGQGLRQNYINKGADTVEAIGRIYCEGNTWAGKVNHFINEFKTQEDKNDLYLNQNNVEL